MYRTAPLRWAATATQTRRVAPYLPLLVLVLLSSTTSFAALAVLSLFARYELAASETEVSVYFVVVALCGMIAMLVTGHLSDLGRARRAVIAAGLAWLGTGYWMLAAVRSYGEMLAVGVVFFCAIGVPNAQLLAYARDLVRRRDDTATSIAVIGMVRVVFSVGSFLGFASGGLGLALLGARDVFRLAAALCFGCLAWSWYALRAGAAAGVPARPRVIDESGPAPDQAGQTATGPRLLVAFAVLMVLFSSGRVMQLAQLPILLRDSLHAPLELVGFALAVPPLCELVLMPAMAWAALRWGRGRVFLFGAATIMVGIDLAQGLMATRAGMATSMYLSHENLAVVHGSLVATVSVAALGHQTGFAVPAVLCLAALALAVGLFARYPGRFDLRRTKETALDVRP